MSKKRDSGMELLRIILMLQVIFLHLAYYGGYHTNVKELGFADKAVYWVLWFMCRCPVYLFIILMGYFMCDSGDVRVGKKFLKIYIPMYFYALAIPLLVGLSGISEISKANAVKSFFPVLSRTWYFLTLYLLVLILSPYLNKLIAALDRGQFLRLIAILFFVFCIWQALSVTEPFSRVFNLDKVAQTQEGKSLYDFIFMYLSGAFLKKYRFLPEKYAEKWNSRNWLNLAAFIALAVLNAGLRYFIPALKPISQYNDNLFCILQCVFLLRFFSKIHFYSGVINAISACNLGVYMIHEHYLIRPILWKRIAGTKNPAFYDTRLYFLKIIGVILAIYFSCVLIEFVRSRIFAAIAKRARGRRRSA